MVLLVGTFLMPKAHSHPVSYKDALAVMTYAQPFLNDTWLVYSFRPDAAFAGRYMTMDMEKGGKFDFYFPQIDYLLKRWNQPDFQANIYLWGGFGGIYFQKKNGTAGDVGIEADLESRKWFMWGKFEPIFPSIGEKFYLAELRLGVAPYEAEFNELASWFMIRGQINHGLTVEYAITPMARFFYKNALWEMGVSFKGDWMINLMFHF